MTRGLLDAGITVLRGVDIDGRVKDIYEQNNPPAKFVKKNVRSPTLSTTLKKIQRSQFDFLVLAGCAPCQPYSSLMKAKQRGNKGSLVAAFGRLAEKLKPDAVILENVPGLDGIKGGLIWRRFVNKLRRLGYLPKYKTIDSKDYGVPQTRKRLVLLAGKGFEIELPAAKYGPTSFRRLKFKTVRTAIARYRGTGLGTGSKVPNHISQRLDKVNLRRIKLIPKDGGSLSDIPKKYWVQCRRDHPASHAETYGRMWWDKPAPTLTSKCTSLSNGRFGHPTRNRPISIREAAALQTFPARYKFPNKPALAGYWIGNAVPVRLARSLGDAVVETLTRNHEETGFASPRTVSQ
jgi:DNA (cytosine-5)-methyltransferase 1